MTPRGRRTAALRSSTCSNAAMELPMRRMAFAVLIASLAGCSLTPSEEDPVQIKLRELDARIARVENANQSLLSFAQRLDASEADLRTLHGEIDELQNSTEAMRKQQRDLYADLEKRIGTGAGSAA